MDKEKQKNCKPHDWCECAGVGIWECHKCQKKKPKERAKTDGGIEDLKYQIVQCLQRFPNTRDSDVDLTIMVWITFWGQYIKLVSGIHSVALEDLHRIPREDHIKRLRAKIQNEEGRYMPTRWEVAKARHIEENKWREALGYNKIQTPQVEGVQEKLI